jgi:hypothetical protein
LSAARRLDGRWPRALQQSAMPVIGFLSLGWQESDARRLTGLRQGLNDTGYVEGQNLAVEYRWGGKPTQSTANVGSFLSPKPSNADCHAGTYRYSRG